MIECRPASQGEADVDERPAELDAICARCLEKDLEQRFADAATLADALDAWLLSARTGPARA